MTLIKTSILTGISTVIKILTGLVINKILSIYAGPSGLAILGQLQNFNSMAMTLSNGAINNGVIKYVAEYQEDIEKKSKLISTAIVITLMCSVVVGAVIALFSSYFSELILKNSDYTSVFIIFGFTIILFSLNSLLMSILNGQKEIKKYVLINIVSSLFSLLFTSFLIVQLNLIGVLYALVLNQSVIFFVTLTFVVRSSWFKIEYFKKGVDLQSLKKLGKYSAMAIVTALTVPMSHLIVRNYIGENLGWDDAGYWQGIWYISTMYLMVISTSLNIYYLPKLSAIQNNTELKKEIFSGYKIIMPIVLIMALIIFLLRDYIILIVFTEKFMPMLDLFAWQLVGDVIKIASLLLGYAILAKAMAKIYIYTEVGFSISFILLSIIFIDTFGLIGMTYAFSMNYSLHLILMIYIFKRNFK